MAVEEKQSFRFFDWY